MGYTVLLIDDNLMNRKMVAKLLEEGGFHVILAENGKDGLKQATQCIPDLILLNIHLSEQNGLQVPQVFKATPGLENTPIIALTAMAMPMDKEIMASNGYFGTISRPINIETFSDTVLAYIQIPKEVSNSLPSASNDGFPISKHFLKSLVSHDLKSPLCAIKIALELLTSNRIGGLSDRQTKLVEQISDTLNKLLAKLNYLHTIHLCESGTLLLNQEAISPKQLLDTVTDRLQYGGMLSKQNGSDNGSTLTMDLEETCQILEALCSLFKNKHFEISISTSDSVFSLSLEGNLTTNSDELLLTYCRSTLKAQDIDFKDHGKGFTIGFPKKHA